MTIDVALYSKQDEAELEAKEVADRLKVDADDVCYSPKSGHWWSASEFPLCAKSRHSALRK